MWHLTSAVLRLLWVYQRRGDKVLPRGEPAERKTSPNQHLNIHPTPPLFRTPPSLTRQECDPKFRPPVQDLHLVQCYDSLVWPTCQMEWNQVGLDGCQKMLNKPFGWEGNSSGEQPEPAAVQQPWGCALIRNQDNDIHNCCKRCNPPNIPPHPPQNRDVGSNTQWIQVDTLCVSVSSTLEADFPSLYYVHYSFTLNWLYSISEVLVVAPAGRCLSLAAGCCISIQIAFPQCMRLISESPWIRPLN